MRRKPIKRVNKERRARNFVKHYHSEQRVWWIHSFPCDACGQERGDIHVAHVKSRGAGGTHEDTVPLGARCHHIQHTQGWAELKALYGYGREEAEDSARHFAAEWKRLNG